MTSLEKRLQISLGISVVILMTLLGWLLITLTQRFTEEFAVTRLQHDSETLLTALHFRGDGTAALKNGKISPIYRQPLSGHYFQFKFADGQFISSRSLWDTSVSVETHEPGVSSLGYGAGPQEQTLLIWSEGFTKQGQVFTLAVAEDMTFLKKRVYLYGVGFAALTLGILAVLLLLQRMIVRRTLSPLRSLSQELKQLEKGEIQKLTDEVPLEVNPLVTEVNRLLDLMTQRLQRSRSALGNLAHELKRPLNLLTQLTTDPDVELSPKLHRELTEYTGQLTKIIDHELKRARLVGESHASKRFDAKEEVPVLVKLLKQIHQSKALSFETNLPSESIKYIDRDDLLELLGNLLDNACKWAMSKVSLSIRVDNGICIVIEDDGEGIDEKDLPELTRRGGRVDESRPGHGLGLSIVREIVEIYHGKLSLSRSTQLGGLRVSVKLVPYPLQVKS